VCWPGYRKFKVRTKVWLYPGEAAWRFASVPPKIAKVIRERFSEFSRGWGSLPVTVTIGKTCWKTSIFPDKKTGSYLLPLKAHVRKEEEIEAGDTITLHIDIRE
jgi:hypothetical protein